MATAAVVVLACGVGWVMHQARPTAQFADVPTVLSKNSDGPRLVGREPTPLEMTLVRAAEWRESNSRSSYTQKRTPSAPAIEIDPQEARLQQVRTFCASATPADLPAIVKFSRDPKLRPATDETMIRVADARTLSAFARREPGAVDRRRLIALIVRRGSKLDVKAFLELLTDSATKQDALTSLDQVSNPPTELLLARLRDSRADLRVAAALALGRIDGPETTRRLIEMVKDAGTRREAFIALASSRGTEAQAFVREAAASETLGGWAKSVLAQGEFH